MTGNYYDLNIISQINVLADADLAIQMGGNGLQWLSTGGNAARQRGDIVNAGGLYEQHLGGDFYEDSILVQADLIADASETVTADPTALVSELVAFMDHSSRSRRLGRDRLDEGYLRPRRYFRSRFDMKHQNCPIGGNECFSTVDWTVQRRMRRHAASDPPLTLASILFPHALQTSRKSIAGNLRSATLLAFADAEPSPSHSSRTCLRFSLSPRSMPNR